MTGTNGSDIGWGFWVRWLIATGLGWAVGVLGAIVLSYLLVNLFYPEETNLIVGLCMGASTAMFQVMAVRRWLRLAGSWVWGGMVTMAPPFIAAAVFEGLSLDLSTLPVKSVLGLITVVGGLIGAGLQARALRPHTRRSAWWVGAIAVSWGLAVAASGVIGFMGGGIVLGAASGGLLVWILRGPGSRDAAGAGRQRGLMAEGRPAQAEGGAG